MIWLQELELVFGKTDDLTDGQTDVEVEIVIQIFFEISPTHVWKWYEKIQKLLKTLISILAHINANNDKAHTKSTKLESSTLYSKVSNKEVR